MRRERNLLREEGRKEEALVAPKPEEPFVVEEYKDMAGKGSFDSGDPLTTNLYVGNINPKVSPNQHPSTRIREKGHVRAHSSLYACLWHVFVAESTLLSVCIHVACVCCREHTPLCTHACGMCLLWYVFVAESTLLSVCMLVVCVCCR